VVEVVKTWCEALDLSRAVTLTLDPGRIPAAELQRYMKPGEDAAALLAECARMVWRSRKHGGGRMVQTYGGGSEEAREALRRAFCFYISAAWNRARTRLKKRYPLQFVRVTELHDDTVRPHLHLLFSQFVPWAELRHVWSDAGGGSNVRIERVRNVRDARKYLVKYLTKSAHSASPGTWPRGMRRIVVSRAISLTLNPEEREALTVYRDRPTDPEGPCLGGHTPAGLEGCDYAQCKVCTWKKRRVCTWKPPGYDPFMLYDSRRGVYVLPLPERREVEYMKAWNAAISYRLHRAIPDTLHGDRRYMQMRWAGFGVPRWEEALPGFTVDPEAQTYHDMITQRMNGGEEDE